jgi:hypothetical protein
MLSIRKVARGAGHLSVDEIDVPEAKPGVLSGCSTQAQNFGQRESSSILRHMSPATKSETPWIVVHDSSPLGGDDGRREIDCCIDRAYLENVALEHSIEIHAFAFLARGSVHATPPLDCSRIALGNA